MYFLLKFMYRQATIRNLLNYLFNLYKIVVDLANFITKLSHEFEQIKQERSLIQSQIQKIREQYTSHDLIIKQFSTFLNHDEIRSYSSIKKGKYLHPQLYEQRVSSNSNFTEFKSRPQSQFFHSPSDIDSSFLSQITPSNQNNNTKIDINNLQQSDLLSQKEYPSSKQSRKTQHSPTNLIDKKQKRQQNNVTETNSTESNSSPNLSQRDIKMEQAAEIQKVLSNIQLFDLNLNSPIQFAFVLVGMKKTGLTSIGHLLSSTVLKAMKIKGKHVIDIVTSKNKNCIIGHQYNSQTQIPNIFQVQNQDKSKFLKKKTKESEKLVIIDSTGYYSNRNNGVLEIISNGYFNYRIFSKVQNMKFILCFDMTQFGRDTYQTISKFIKTFKNFEKIKKDIFESSCFLFNKVREWKGGQNHNGVILEEIHQRLRVIINKQFMDVTSSQYLKVTEFIEQMIKNDRIFTIKSYKDGEYSNDFQLLNKIQSKVNRWFWRQFNSQKSYEVDMTNIKFNISQHIKVSRIANDLSQQKLTAFIKYQNHKIDSFLVPNENPNPFQLQLLIQRLINDAMGKLNDHNFIHVTKNCHQKYSRLRPDLAQRQREQKRLFEVISSESTKSTNVSPLKMKSKNFTVKKFMSLKKIFELISQVNNNNTNQINQICLIEDCQRAFIQIIKQLQLPSYRNENRKKIIRYGYQLFRMIQESKVFILIMGGFQTQPTNSKNINLNSDDMLINLVLSLRTFLNHPIMQNEKVYQSIQDLQKEYVQKFDMKTKQNMNLDLNEEFVDIFIKANPIKQSTKLKVVNIILAYARKVLNDSTNSIHNNEILCRLTTKLIKGMSYCIEMIKNYPESINLNLMIFKLGKSLGYTLQIQKKYQLSIKAYRSVLCIDSVCRIYELQIAELEKQQKQSFKTRIEYGEYLGNNNRNEDRRKLLQRTYQMVESSEDLKLIQSELYNVINLTDLLQLVQLDEGIFNLEKFGNLDDIDLQYFNYQHHEKIQSNLVGKKKEKLEIIPKK